MRGYSSQLPSPAPFAISMAKYPQNEGRGKIVVGCSFLKVKQRGWQALFLVIPFGFCNTLC